MIVLSLFLVIAAAATLVAGFFQEGLALVWTSIGLCLLALLFLGFGVLQRRRAQPAGSGTSGYASSGGTATSAKPASSSGKDDDAAASDQEAREVTVTESETDEDLAVARTQEPEGATAPAVHVGDEDDEGPQVIRKTTVRPGTARKAVVKKAVAKKAVVKKAVSRPQAATEPAPERTEPEPEPAAPAAASVSGGRGPEALKNIPGVGPAKQKALLAEFGDVDSIADASEEELQQVRGIGPAVAAEIKRALG